MEAININDFNNHKLSEEKIIQRILAGEKELFEILLRRNNQKLYRVVRSYLKDAAEIEDIMQNTHLKAFEKLYQFKQTSTYATWLIRIGINESLARLKEKGKVYNLQRGSDDRVLEIFDDGQTNPEGKMIREEAKHLLEKTIDQLDSKYKTAYVLKEIEGMRIQEISECLNISPANVKIRIHRAKTILKERLYHFTQGNHLFEFGFSRCDKITYYVMGNIA